MTSNRSIAEWSTAILDRLLPDSHVLTIHDDIVRLRAMRRSGLIKPSVEVLLHRLAPEPNQYERVSHRMRSVGRLDG
ncbi:hypothetical protein GGE24_007270 [Bradyrhizobium centrosematis]|uniref:hypothetical protein n=1 Tax=Bradyrhizobium centrosematis TaxID=1300039 RepID=UPI0035B63899|nr:hypothetical protein [Bradyrhizobium centrosematis]MCS3777895.1 hypothetical protein [Bradyrhizobium centrosematis]